MYVRMDVREVSDRLPEIPQILKDLGSSQAALARHLDLDKSSIGRAFRGDRDLKADEAIRIADFITNLEREKVGGVREAGQRFTHIAGAMARDGRGPAQVPLFGFSAAGPLDRIDMKRGREIDFIAAPVNLAAGAELFALRIPTHHLAPRFRAGDRVFAVRNLPPEAGKDCVVEFLDGSATLRTFLSVAGDEIRVEYWAITGEKSAALKSETLKRSEVTALHQVTSSL